jgi:hypothetical protein
MKRILVYLLIQALFSCATSSISVQNLGNSKDHYDKIFTCIIDKPLTVHAFDSAFYEESVKDHFNNLGNLQVRKQLERTLKRNLGNALNEIVPSSDLFVVNENITYSDFKEHIKNAGAKAILLINEESSWDTPNYRVAGNSVQYSGEPNTAFHCYLIDAESGKIVWLSCCVVRGIWAGYDTLNNTLARRIANKLRESGYIL